MRKMLPGQRTTTMTIASWFTPSSALRRSADTEWLVRQRTDPPSPPRCAQRSTRERDPPPYDKSCEVEMKTQGGSIKSGRRGLVSSWLSRWVSRMRAGVTNCWPNPCAFFSAAALLAMHSAVIPTAIPSVCPSVCPSHKFTFWATLWKTYGQYTDFVYSSLEIAWLTSYLR